MTLQFSQQEANLKMAQQLRMLADALEAGETRVLRVTIEPICYDGFLMSYGYQSPPIGIRTIIESFYGAKDGSNPT